MKAKLLQAVEISENEMLEAGIKVDVITSYCGCNGNYYVCELSNRRQVNINSQFLEITDWHPYIDWEQRRYEIAKSAINGILSDEDEVGYACSEVIYKEREIHTTPKAVARFAVACADALIEELKEGGNHE